MTGRLGSTSFGAAFAPVAHEGDLRAVEAGAEQRTPDIAHDCQPRIDARTRLTTEMPCSISLRVLAA